MKKVLIDTNAYSRLLQGDQEILRILGKAEVVFLSIFVLAELYTGFKGGFKEKQNRQWLGEFMAKPSVRICEATEETAEIFSEIKHRLKKEGNPIPVHDIWIAAHAIETGAVLISFDQHFSKIAGLRVY